MEDTLLHQRIIYVEPNDVFDKEANNAQGDLSLTPKYEDFCISFNLIIEQFNRYKPDGMAPDANGRSNENGNPHVYQLQWGLTQEDMVKRRTSVLQGNKGEPTINYTTGEVEYPYSDQYNYLTTYYTDLTFDSYGKKTEIEGLGVESVQVSYESWYTPTVTIKFIDVRGSAIFGREEAIHVDSQLMEENVFGAFFTMPYPLFRLQVKGFYGRPVTYQLTCSSFKGEFNSQTGNFEAVATFIGYSWSLLTDIPFAYLVAAPYATYIGSEYWEKKKKTEEWGLWNDTQGVALIQPPRLYDLFKNIKEALKNSEYGQPNKEQSEELSQMAEEKKLLNDLKEKRLKFFTSLKEDVGGNGKNNSYLEITDNEAKNTQLLLFYSSTELKLIDDTKRKYDEYYEALKAYKVADYKNGCDISTDKAPNKWIKKDDDETSGIPDTLTFKKIFTISRDGSGNIIQNIYVEGVTNETVTKEDLLEKDFDGRKLTNNMAEALAKNINDKTSNILEYCYLIDEYDIPQQADDRSKEMQDRENRITQEINEAANKNIIEILGGINNGGFKPFIGNVFKIIFCHLETFCHIMFDSAKEIYDQMKTGKRNPSELGITMDQTDIRPLTMKNVTPWPALFNAGIKTSECGYENPNKWANIYGWVGDISSRHAFIEEKVVYAIQEGIQMLTAEEGLNSDKAINFSAFPILPSDYLNDGVFSSVTIGNISELAGHLGDRIGAIFGVMCNNNLSDEMATTLGRLDAYNLFRRCGSVLTFNNATKDIDVDILEGIIYCKEDEKYNKYTEVTKEGDSNARRHSFETALRIDTKFTKPVGTNRTRHPFFQDSGKDQDLYIHYYDNNKVNYVPAIIKDFKTYKVVGESEFGDFIFKIEQNPPYFLPKTTTNENTTTAHDWLHVCDSTQIEILKDIDIKKYTNKQMFNIITDTAMINGIKNKCNELRTGNIKLMDYEVKDDLNEFVDKFLGADNKFYAQCFNRVGFMLSGNATKLQLDKEKFLPTNIEVTPKMFNWMWYETNDADSKIKNHVTVDDECNLKWNDEQTTLSDVVIQDFMVNYITSYCNIFGCPFYYKQNTILDKEKTDTQFHNKRALRSKAYLFLHTFRYSGKIPTCFSDVKKNGTIQTIPKALVLFYGAILWRKRFYEENNYDPIVAFEHNNERYPDANIKIFNPGVNYTFIKKPAEREIEDFVVFKENDPKANQGSYYSLANFGADNIDYNMENQLIELFENFVDNTFNKIDTKYSIRKDNKVITSFDLISFISQYKNKLEDKENNKGTDEDIWNKIKELNGLFGTYSAILVQPGISYSQQGLKMLFNEDNKEDQELFKDLYFNPYVIVDNCYKKLGRKPLTSGINDNNKIYVKKSLMKAYLKGFTDATGDIIHTQTVSVGNDTNLNVSSNTFKNRDLSLAIYYYLKNLWDKWMVIAQTDAFNVDKFFDENFIFIDSFYKNVYNKLAINCEQLLDAWTQLADNGSLFHFLSQIVTKHGCIFLPVPDYIGFNGKGTDEDDKHDVEMMRDLFRPMPYNEMPAPSNSNKFIVMYTHSPSHVKSEQNSYRLDSYDIWSHKDHRISEVAEKLFEKEKPSSSEGTLTRLGYNVPSFGIAFAKQNNHIFKNLRLTMDNPVMTEQAIKAQWSIAVTGGSSEAHSIHFIGQDTFNVFSNYSYSITVEMMGNAQICPLMYFQLLNVPLWKGTYMIYKVVHNMTPGNMTTTITAMKMSKFAQPFNTSFFTMHKIKKAEQNGNGLNSNCDDGTSTTSSSGGSSYVGGTVKNGPQITVKDKNAYNIVLWRYHKDSTLWPGRKGGYNEKTKKTTKPTRPGHSIEGVLYEYEAPHRILAWTIQSDSYDLIKDSTANPCEIVPGAYSWLSPGKPEYHFGCSYYCAKKANGRGGFGQSGQPKSMLACAVGNGGCLFHPGPNAGGGWTEGCILTGEKAVNGNRPNFDKTQFHKNNIDSSNNPNVVWWRNFYNNVVPAICSGKKVHMYVKTDYRDIQYDGGIVQTNSSVNSKPTGKLVDIMSSLPADLKQYVIINPLYAKEGGNYNFGNRCMPGYKKDQTYLWIGEKTMKRLEECVRFMKNEYQNYKLMIWDAYRPYSAADKFLDIYNQANPNYKGKTCDNKEVVEGKFIARVSNGAHSGSDHCTGNAIDLTLCDQNGNELILTKNQNYTCPWAIKTKGFDEFSLKAYKTNGNGNYQILKKIMGYNNNFNVKATGSEFWHFTTKKGKTDYSNGIPNECDGTQNYG